MGKGTVCLCVPVVLVLVLVCVYWPDTKRRMWRAAGVVLSLLLVLLVSSAHADLSDAQVTEALVSLAETVCQDGAYVCTFVFLHVCVRVCVFVCMCVWCVCVCVCVAHLWLFP